MSTLITADLHLTDNPRDADRWGLFPWLADRIEENRVRDLLILGDLTDAKDRHNSALVNRIVTSLWQISRLCPVTVLRGNHDFVDEDNPFFGFLQRIPGVTYPASLMEVNMPVGGRAARCLFVPAQRRWSETMDGYDFSPFDYVFCHQTFSGCKSENGTVLEGVPPSVFRGFSGKVWSGDIHVPQKVGRSIEYVGAPYHIKFGDDFPARVVLLRAGKQEDLHYQGQPRILAEVGSVDELAKMKIEPGAQVKVRVHISPAEFPEWRAIKAKVGELAHKRGWHLFGPEAVRREELRVGARPRLKVDAARPTPAQLVRQFGEANKLTTAQIDVGLELLSGGEE